jgi:hypothetical protein
MHSKAITKQMGSVISVMMGDHTGADKSFGWYSGRKIRHQPHLLQSGWFATQELPTGPFKKQYPLWTPNEWDEGTFNKSNGVQKKKQLKAQTFFYIGLKYPTRPLYPIIK